MTELILRRTKWVKWWLVFGLCLWSGWLGLQLLEQNSINEVFELTFLNVGQGDATLIQSPDGYYGLIDGGKGKLVLEELKQKVVGRRLEFVMATHPDADHVEGLLKVIRYFDVKYFFWQKHSKVSPVFEELKKEVAKSKMRSFVLSDSNDFRLGCCVNIDETVRNFLK